jgi:hypothetical protein
MCIFHGGAGLQLILKNIAALLLPALLVSACVPVILVDKDVQYEKLKDGVYFLNVTAPTDAEAEQLRQTWQQQAGILCAGAYRDDAQVFQRTAILGRNHVVQYQQMRGNVYCQ